MKNIEFLINLRERIQAPLKKIIAMKEKMAKPVSTFATLKTKVQVDNKSIGDLKNRLERLTSIRDRFTDPARIQRFNKEIEKVNHSLNKMQNTKPGGLSKIFESAKGFLAAQAITALTTGVINFGRESVMAFSNAAKVDAQLAAALKSTGGAAGLTMDQLKSQAEGLAKVTLFDDDATKGAQALLLTFTDIKGAVFNDTIPVIQDLATAMAGTGPADLKGASIQVGKALNDPIKGITALSKVGVSFTKGQKDMIEN